MWRTLWTLMLVVGCGGDADADSATTGQPETRKASRSQFDIKMTNVSAPGAITTTGGERVDVKWAPGVLIFHEPGLTLFTEGEALPSTAMESLVEEGDNAPLIALLEADPLVAFVDSFAALDETYNDTPMGPGDRALLSEKAREGLSLTLAAMYGESNDLFVATPPGGIPLFDEDGVPLVDDITALMTLWDAGTEVNEEPGTGPHQPARQAAAGAGEVEGGVVVAVEGTDAMGFAYPRVVEMLEVTVKVPE